MEPAPVQHCVCSYLVEELQVIGTSVGARWSKALLAQLAFHAGGLMARGDMAWIQGHDLVPAFSSAGKSLLLMFFCFTS